MDKKQYLAMATIMQESRNFAMRMFSVLQNAGLVDKRLYHLKLDIGVIPYKDKQLCSIELAPSLGVENADWFSDGMKQNYFQLKGWEIDRDPFGKSGTVPLDICPFGMPNIICADGGCPNYEKAERDETEPCDRGMWFSADDNDPPVVCRGDLNGSMAESDPGV